MLQKTHKTRFPNLNSSSSLEQWRQAKDIVDNDIVRLQSYIHDQLGCVGKPISVFIEEHLDLDHNEHEALLKAVGQARDNLLFYIQGARDTAAQEALQEALLAAQENLTCDGMKGFDITPDTTIESIYEQGHEDALFSLACFRDHYTPPTIDDADL